MTADSPETFTGDPVIDAVMSRLYREDAAQRRAGLPASQRTRNIDRESGRFLALTAHVMNAQWVLEIGSSNGLSTIWFASAMRRTGGRVIGTELKAVRAAEANANLAEAGLSDQAEVIAGDARATLTTLEHAIDLAFIDAEKEDYAAHFETVFPLVRTGGLILADNVVSHDCRDYQAMLRARPDVDTVTLPIERGIEFTVKR